MGQTLNIRLLNGSVKAKTLTGSYFSLSGIKDSGTQTGTVTNGIVDWSLQNYTKSTAQWGSDTTTILLRGQIGLEDTGTTTFKIKIGNGIDLWPALGYSGGTTGTVWGAITGPLSDQNDLQTALNGKQNTITTGTTSQYFRGDLSLATFPTAVSSFTNDSGYVTPTSVSTFTNKTGAISQWTNDSGYLTTTIAASTYEPIVPASTTVKYYRGDKTFQTLDTAAVPENTNLYYTQTRFNTAFATKTTADLTESGNLYFTEARTRATPLTGLSVAGSSITVTDTVIQAFGKIQNQINGVLGGAIYQSTWAASTNTPTLADGTGTKGYYYVASNNGVVNFGSGNIDFNTGDWAIYNGTIWQKVDNTDAVSSVNGTLGAVTITTTGTTNRITVSGGSGLTPTIDISATFEALLGKVASPLSQFASTTSTQLLGIISDETGSGSLVFATSPTLVTPILGTPASGTLTNCTGLPIVAGTTGTLTVARGGTLLTSTTDTQVFFADGANTFAQNSGFTYQKTTTVAGGILQLGGNTYSARTGLAMTIGAREFYLVSDIIASGFSSFHVAAPSSSNYQYFQGASLAGINNGSQVDTRIAGVVKISSTASVNTYTNTQHSFLGLATNSGVTTPFIFTTPLSTAQTAGTETIGWDFDGATNSVQHASNTGYALQRDTFNRGRTHRAVSATCTIDDAFTTYSTPPVAGTNLVITRAWAGGVAGRLGVLTNVMVGSLTTAATAYVHTIASTTSAGTANSKATNGVLMTSAEAGTQELANDWYFTKGDFALRYGLGGAIFDHYADAGNTTTTETDIYSDTIAASRLSVNGQKLQAEYGLTFVVSATATREIRVYFGGNLIFDTGALTVSAPTLGNASVVVYITIIRDSATTIRYNVTANTNGASTASYANTGKVTGLTLSNSNVLKITGQAAGATPATNDIVGYQSHINYLAAA